MSCLFSMTSLRLVAFQTMCLRLGGTLQILIKLLQILVYYGFRHYTRLHIDHKLFITGLSYCKKSVM